MHFCATLGGIPVLSFPSFVSAFPFRIPRYWRINAARLNHLASLSLPIRNATVLDVNAGIGDHAQFYRDRGCSVTLTDIRPALLRYMARRFPGEHVYRWDTDHPETDPPPVHDIVHCYGALYHVSNPAAMIRGIARACGSLLVLESIVCPDTDCVCPNVHEKSYDPTQAYFGTGCRPSRAWIRKELLAWFPWVYLTRTQPDHEEFPLDWSDLSSKRAVRAVFVASRTPLASPALTQEIPLRYGVFEGEARRGEQHFPA